MESTVWFAAQTGRGDDRVSELPSSSGAGGGLQPAKPKVINAALASAIGLKVINPLPDHEVIKNFQISIIL
jgi:hypothetical protein